MQQQTTQNEHEKQIFFVNMNKKQRKIKIEKIRAEEKINKNHPEKNVGEVFSFNFHTNTRPLRPPNFL